MERKNLIATLFLKNGMAVSDFDNLTPLGEAADIVKLYNDSGIDKIIFYDLSETPKEQDNTITKIRELNRIFEIPVYGAGNIHNLKDIKNLLYSGCQKVILNSSDPDNLKLIEEAKLRYGIDKLSISLEKVDVLFKQKDMLEKTFDEIFVLDESIIDAITNLTEIPFTPLLTSMDISDYIEILKKETCNGIGGELLNNMKTDVMILKNKLSSYGLNMNTFESKLSWSEFNLDENGLIAVIAQDYSTSEVLTFGYMDEKAFQDTIKSGKMNYYNIRTGETLMKGEESEQFQYVKSLTVDCHKKAILAKISQIGVSCHTGNYSCFFDQIVRKDYLEKNTFKVFENVYNVINDRRKNPKEGSYTNYLYEQGMDEVLKKIWSEIGDLILEAKNGDSESMRSEITDLIYHLMVLMNDNDLRWEDITAELIQR